MSETPRPNSKPKLAWYQCSLRFLFVLTVVVAFCVSAMMTDVWPPFRSSIWSNQFGSRYPRPNAYYYVGAFEINDWEPTIGYFVRFESQGQTEKPQIKWLEHEDTRVRVNGRRIYHRRGTFKLFVDDGSGSPVQVTLDPADRRKYFDLDNVFFTNGEAGDEFWNEVLLKKYSLYPKSTKEE